MPRATSARNDLPDRVVLSATRLGPLRTLASLAVKRREAAGKKSGRMGIREAVFVAAAGVSGKDPHGCLNARGLPS